ncbi:unnamed protein product (macronuclear) [Paramecium tetraurelia]|uniref:Uncharacterized protein n=1 Tax=Paramecium tetraurelia TaxID=5888 RepID=A0DBH4_PARTE|nr:uncharacterized protein GSPATT00015286001 [Paramecium tetraurelia]CAK80391.1 unnamed protein product [Paramecium tetraurelia]|eukprot:XP_001447788.1 hypothetical protein (macronuclear) [Paramecium tetraurelia strain d4-2]
MEKKIIEFIQDCQTNIGNCQDLSQMEEIVHQLISIVYFLIEQGQQTFEEEKQKYQTLNQEFLNLQALYKESLQEIEALKVHHKQDVEEFSIIEDRLIKQEYFIEKEKDEQLYNMKSSTNEMMQSLRIQQFQLENVKKQNEDQQMEIKELKKLLIQQKQSNIEPAAVQEESKLQTQLILKGNINSRSSCGSVMVKQQGSCSSIELNQQSNQKENVQTENCSQTILCGSSLKEAGHLLKYTHCHSKNQSINWVKLATIAQTQQSISNSDDEDSVCQKSVRRLSKDLSTGYEPLLFGSRNPYKDYYSLISQSVKLNLNQTKYYVVNVDMLYDQFLAEGVPFHKWYNKIKDYILRQAQ